MVYFTVVAMFVANMRRPLLHPLKSQSNKPDISEDNHTPTHFLKYGHILVSHHTTAYLFLCYGVQEE